MIFETKRLILRPWKESEAGELYRWAKDPAVGPAAGWPAHTDVEESLEIIRTVFAAPETYALVLKETGLPVGSIGLKMVEDTDLTQDPREAEVGYWLAVPYWGRGLMPEALEELMRHAFEDLDMTRLWCGWYDGNHKSWSVQRKCGFLYHHTTEGLEVPLLKEIRTGHVSTLSREQWRSRHE